MNTGTIAMTSVPNHQRADFWQIHFGNVKGFSTFEVVIFTTMGQFCEDYHGGYWEYCTLSNGGAFIYPDLNQEELMCSLSRWLSLSLSNK